MTIFQFESVFENIAILEQKRDTIIICDRGGMDPKVFTEKEEDWETITSKLDFDDQKIMDRYESVIQLFTAPKEYYTVEDNPQRRETFEEAERINQKYEEVWSDHPNFHQVDNYDHRNPENLNNLGWEGKFNKVWEIIQNILDS